MNKKVCFSFFSGEPPIPVTVFKERSWSFTWDLELRASIIGKSHRIVSRTANGSFTEFIAYPEGNELFKPIDHFQINAGTTYQKSYRQGDLLYQVQIEAIPRLFENMNDFMQSLQECDWQILNYEFEENQKRRGPFTGIAADLARKIFHTVHTYPEYGHSIVSQSKIQYPAK